MATNDAKAVLLSLGLGDLGLGSIFLSPIGLHSYSAVTPNGGDPITYTVYYDIDLEQWIAKAVRTSDSLTDYWSCGDLAPKFPPPGSVGDGFYTEERNDGGDTINFLAPCPGRDIYYYTSPDGDGAATYTLNKVTQLKWDSGSVAATVSAGGPATARVILQSIDAGFTFQLTFTVTYANSSTKTDSWTFEPGLDLNGHAIGAPATSAAAPMDQNGVWALTNADISGGGMLDADNIDNFVDPVGFNNKIIRYPGVF